MTGIVRRVVLNFERLFRWFVGFRSRDHSSMDGTGVLTALGHTWHMIIALRHPLCSKSTMAQTS